VIGSPVERRKVQIREHFEKWIGIHLNRTAMRVAIVALFFLNEHVVSVP
jgi:hypothetical protein